MNASFYDDLVRYANILNFHSCITDSECDRIINRIRKAARKAGYNLEEVKS